MYKLNTSYKKICILIVLMTFCLNLFYALNMFATSNYNYKDMFSNNYIYKHSQLDLALKIPDSWANAYGVIEKKDGVVFVHYNDKNIYAPLLEINRHDSKEERDIYIELLKSDDKYLGYELKSDNSKVYSIKVSSEKYYDYTELDDLKSYKEMCGDMIGFLQTIHPNENDVKSNSGSLFEYIIKDMSEINSSKPLLAVGYMEKGIQQFGYVNVYGEFIIPPVYSSANPFVNGIAIVEKDGLYGAIDENGEVVLDFVYEWLGDYENELIPFCTMNDIISPNELSDDLLSLFNYQPIPAIGYMDIKGNVIVPPQFVTAKAYSFDMAAVMNSKGRWGYINKQGDYVLLQDCDYAGEFSNGIALVTKNRQSMYIDIYGNILFYLEIPQNYPYSFISSKFQDGFILKRKFPDNASKWREEQFQYYDDMCKWILVDKFGRAISNKLFDDVRYSYKSSEYVNENIVGVEIDDKWGAVNKNGEIIVSTSYDFLNVELNGFTVAISGRYGYLNNQLDETIPLIFYKIENFYNGLARAYICGLDVVINEQGDILWYQNSNS